MRKTLKKKITKKNLNYKENTLFSMLKILI